MGFMGLVDRGSPPARNARTTKAVHAGSRGGGLVVRNDTYSKTVVHNGASTTRPYPLNMLSAMQRTYCMLGIGTHLPMWPLKGTL
jgi:hypothetical protein